MFSRRAGSLWSAAATRVGCLRVCTVAVVLWQSASLQAGYLGIEVTNSPDSGGATQPSWVHETLSLYIRPTHDIIVTHLGYHNSWKVLSDFRRDNGTPDEDNAYLNLRLTDPHTLGIFETDPSFYHSEDEPGNGTLLISTVMDVGEGVEENYFEFKPVAPTLLQAGKLYAIAGTGTLRHDNGTPTILDDGDRVTSYFFDGSDPTGGSLNIGPGFELLGGAFSYVDGLAEPYWYDVSGYPDFPPGFVFPGSAWLGPGFKYELAAQPVPEPSTALLGLLGAGGLGLYRRWSRPGRPSETLVP